MDNDIGENLRTCKPGSASMNNDIGRRAGLMLAYIQGAITLNNIKDK